MEGAEPPILPRELTYLWEIYCDIFKGLDEKVTWVNLDHYQNVIGSKLTPYEASLMIDIDLVRRRNG